MGFALSDRDATVEAGVRRVAVERIDDAVAALGGTGPREEAVHTVRKRMKQARALVRLVAPALPKARREDRAFRDAARRLSGARDAAVLARTFADLAKTAPRTVDVDVAYAVRTAIAGGTPVVADAAVDAEVMMALAEARERAAAWTLKRDGWAALEDGLRDTYALARKSMKGALKGDDDEAVHEWRKAAKAHFYHLELLRPCWPAGLKPSMKAADTLQEALGDHHDLALLAQFLDDHAGDVGGAAAVDPVKAIVRQRQDAIEAEAHALGARLFAEAPDAFADRIRSYWKEWRRETKPARLAA